MLIKIQAERVTFNTQKNLINLKGKLQLENETFKLVGSAITVDLKKALIHSNEKTTILLKNSEIEAGKIQVFKVDPNKSHLKFILEDGVRFKYSL